MFGDVSKKTLLMTAGYNSSIALFNTCFKDLSSNFRVIAFDQLSNGPNTRLETCSGMDSDRRAFECLIEWYEEFFRAIDHLLPAKVCFYAASSSCHAVGLWAARHPDRIDKLFFASPSGVETGPPKDISRLRIQTESNTVLSKKAAELYK